MDNKLTYRQIMPIWWSIIWRILAAGVLPGFIALIPIGLIAGANGFTTISPLFALAVSYIFSIPGTIWAVHNALSKHNVLLDVRPVADVFE